ncbi:hypothetical protein [Nostoc sp. CHAB 5715]|uniref:hypothetical protein n=1 Tax=Nostoc sp. CHAB 5715 TaxID=2780400 RepID=UPI001E53B384|nr:hypothetical protein [Nostoc sp. CHAB 5715]MCC5621454.1 hypothetical protein [Nostoc sp. CHAB 5715]
MVRQRGLGGFPHERLPNPKGEYNTSLPEVIFENQQTVNTQDLEELVVKCNKEITITYGYSRDQRPDLKQFIIELICSGDGDIPIFYSFS